MTSLNYIYTCNSCCAANRRKGGPVGSTTKKCMCVVMMHQRWIQLTQWITPVDWRTLGWDQLVLLQKVRLVCFIVKTLRVQ